jgi:hypothetical protein
MKKKKKKEDKDGRKSQKVKREQKWIEVGILKQRRLKNPDGFYLKQ